MDKIGIDAVLVKDRTQWGLKSISLSDRLEGDEFIRWCAVPLLVPTTNPDGGEGEAMRLRFMIECEEHTRYPLFIYESTTLRVFEAFYPFYAMRGVII